MYCRSSQVLSSLCVLGREAWIDGDALRRFILCCQDADDGGISDKPGTVATVALPTLRGSRSTAHTCSTVHTSSTAHTCSPSSGDEADVFHTFFGIAGLSLLTSDGVFPIDPAHALPVSVMTRLRAQQKSKACRV